MFRKIWPMLLIIFLCSIFNFVSINEFVKMDESEMKKNYKKIIYKIIKNKNETSILQLTFFT